MTTLLLRLAGPRQAWDARRSWGVPTRSDPARIFHAGELIPTHTGLTGLIAAALSTGTKEALLRRPGVSSSLRT